MRVFVQFNETYLEWISQVCFSLKEKAAPEPVMFCGLAHRRKTVCPKLDALTGPMGLDRYDWLNDVEKGVLAADVDVPARLEHYRSLLGDKKLRLIVNCDRELGGNLSGGRYARTRLKKMIARDPALRWKYVVGLLDYFTGRFRQEKPDLIFFNEVSFAWEMAAYLAAEQMKIPFFTLCYVRSGMGYAVVGNAFDRCESIERVFKQSASNPGLLQAHIQEAADMVAALRKQPVSPDYTVAFEKKLKKGASLWGILRTLVVDLLKCAAVKMGLLGTRGILRFEDWWDMTRWNVQAAWQTRKCLRTNKIFETSGTYLNAPYLYYPLHVEPEASTLVFSSAMNNQLFFIEQLSRNMPAGFKLLVKEHLSMIGRRPEGFYQRIKSLPDVALISPADDNFALIKGARAVAVLSGTSGWEAILQGIPVIVVGTAQYLGIGSGFIVCDDLLNLDQVIQRAFALAPVPDEVLIRYIAASKSCLTGMDAHSIAYGHYGLSPDESIKPEGISGLADQLLELYKQYPEPSSLPAA